jgi:hypothetical protein
MGGGTLALGSAGSIDATSGVALSNGGTFDISAKGGYSVANLSGNGTVLGTLVISGNLSIGNSPGTANFENLTLDSDATYVYEVAGGTNAADLGNVSGLLDITGATLDVVQLGSYTLGDKFTLFGYATGNLTGTFAGLSDNSTFNEAGGDWTINYADASPGLNGGFGTSFVTIMAVPEPGTLALLACGGAIGVGLLRRRRKGMPVTE